MRMRPKPLRKCYWQISSLRRLVVQGCVIWALLSGVLVGSAGWVMAASGTDTAIGVAIGVVVALTASVAAGAAVSVAAGMTVGVAVGVVGGVAVIVADIVAVPVAAQEDAYLEPTEDLEQTSRGNVVQMATMAYHQGMRDLDRADKLEEKAAAESAEAKREKLLKKALAARESATQQFLQALRNEPEMIEAYVALGGAFRSLGKYQEALEIHAIALRRDPESMENFQGWAAALLELNMLGNATASYTRYAEEGSPRAEILMGEMQKWLTARQADPGEIDPAHIERMAAWMAEQGQGG